MTAIRASIVGATSRHQQQRFHCDLPVRQVGFLFRQAGDVVGGATKRDELTPVRKRYGILELALPALVSHHAKLPA